jgi:hypothetical protein
MKMKQLYTRTYAAGRPTNGWDKGERVTDDKSVKPGDVLIMVSNQFKAENLIRVIERNHLSCNGFNYEYADCRTLVRSDGGTMFCHGFELAGPQREFYRAIDRRPVNRSRQRVSAKKLPRWLSYAKERT